MFKKLTRKLFGVKDLGVRLGCQAGHHSAAYFMTTLDLKLKVKTIIILTNKSTLNVFTQPDTLPYKIWILQQKVLKFFLVGLYFKIINISVDEISTTVYASVYEENLTLKHSFK